MRMGSDDDFCIIAEVFDKYPLLRRCFGVQIDEIEIRMQMAGFI